MVNDLVLLFGEQNILTTVLFVLAFPTPTSESMLNISWSSGWRKMPFIVSIIKFYY